jgi:hypothetical protein
MNLIRKINLRIGHLSFVSDSLRRMSYHHSEVGWLSFFWNFDPICYHESLTYNLIVNDLELLLKGHNAELKKVIEERVHRYYIVGKFLKAYSNPREKYKAWQWYLYAKWFRHRELMYAASEIYLEEAEKLKEILLTN